MSSQVLLRLLPSARCLFDEPIQVKVSGLRSRQLITMRTRATNERGVAFSASALYRADPSGEVDLERDPSLGGSYTGVEPMGLLWSLKADAPHQYFHWNKVMNPHVVRFSACDEDGEESRILAEATNERYVIAEGVSRVVVQGDNFQGVLFTPAGEGPFPGVLDLCTFMSEKRACLLANKGFVVLAVSVYTDKPVKVKEMHLDHFQEAVDFLQQQPTVGRRGIGVMSRSKGGDVALSLASFVPGIKAVVWINGCSANVAVPLYYKTKKILSPLMFDVSKVLRMSSGASIVKYGVPGPESEEIKGCLVPIERAHAHLLFVASEDDLNWDSKAYMDEMVDRLKRHGKKNFESVLYPRAGHLLEPPYGPFCESGIHGIIRDPVMWGGDPKTHAAAEVHLWKKMVEYFRDHLGDGTSLDKAKL